MTRLNQENRESHPEDFPGVGCRKTFVNAALGGTLTQCWSSERPTTGTHRRKQPVPLLPLHGMDPPVEGCRNLCAKCLEIAIQDYFIWSHSMSSRHLSNLMAANWREPPEARGPMGNVILMTLDILPQAQSYEEFGTRSKDIPPFKILFLIDNWSSKILDFELADSPSQVSTQIAARAYLGMIERHQMIPFHLAHVIEDEVEVHNVLAAHSSLRELNTTREIPWLDQIYTPYSNEKDARKYLTQHTITMIDRMDEAILPLTKVIRKGFKLAENEWDARDPIKVGVFYFVWSNVIRKLCEDYVQVFNAHPFARSHGHEMYGANDLFHDGASLGIPVHGTHASSLFSQLHPECLGSHKDLDIIDAVNEKCRSSWNFMKRQGQVDYDIESTWPLYRSLVRSVEASTLSTLI